MKYWVIAPMESTTPDDLFTYAWNYDIQHGTIAIGWNCTQTNLQDISQIANFEDFLIEVAAANPGWGPRAPKMIWNFHDTIEEGDVIFARRGLNQILGFGLVTKKAYYDAEKGYERIGASEPLPENLQSHFRPRFIEIAWQVTGSFPAKLAWRRTVQEITGDQCNQLVTELQEHLTDAEYQKIQAALTAETTPSRSEEPEPAVQETEAPATSEDSTATEQKELSGELITPFHKWEQSEAADQKETSTKPITTPPVTSKATVPAPDVSTPEPDTSSEPKKPNFYIGIDLGTTNSVMGWGTINPQTNQIEPKIVEINMMIERGGIGKRELLPSCVYFKEGSRPIVGEYAKTMIGRQTARVVKSIKSEIGSQKYHDFDNTRYTPSEISAQILTHLATSAKSHFGFIPDDVVITVPASFDSDMRNATIEAAKLTGFRTTEDDGSPRNILLDEPRAALYDFINRQNKGEIPETLINFHDPKLVLVFDLGGGTLDVSLHRVSYQQKEQGLNIEDLAISRYTKIGGDNFDQRLADRFLAAYESKIPEDLDDFQRNLLKSAFREYAEQAKIDLSSEIENGKLMGYLELDTVETTIIQTPFENQVFQYDLPLTEYEDIVEPLLGNKLTLEDVEKFDTLQFNDDNIIYPILDVLKKAQLKIGEYPKVDAVLLNGGMTKLHTVQNRLETFFGFPPITAGDPDKAVARGAVVYHYDLHRGIKPSRILNDTISIEITGGTVRPLVEAGTILPLSQPKPIEGLQVSADAHYLKLPFYLGSRTDTKPPNRRILERRVKFESQRPFLKDEPIFIQVQVDERGILNVEGWSKDNPADKFTVTVDSTQPPAETTLLRPDQGTAPSGTVSTEAIPPPRSRALNLDIREELIEMRRHYSNYMRTHRKDVTMAQIKRQSTKVLHAENAQEFIKPLIDTVQTVNNFGKSRIMILLGELAARCATPDQLYDICDAATFLSNPIELKYKHPKVINSVVRYAVEAIGKTQLSLAESHLIQLLNQEKATSIQSSIIYSMGKCCQSLNAIEHLKPLIQGGSDSARIAVNWTFGKIGSRERENPIPIHQLDSVITTLIKQLKTERHADVQRNGIYALGEICDRRDCTDDSVNEETAAAVISLLETFTKPSNVVTSLSDLGSMQQAKTLQRFAGVSAQMIKGIELSHEQRSSLLTIREEN